MTSATVILKTHRYEFSEYAMMQLNYFTQVHKYDERKIFKESWEKWIKTEEIAQMIVSETQKLNSEGFQGDVQDKMFKAVRYYFRKKANTEEKKEQNPRKKYIGFTGKILTAMDTHIILKIKENMQETCLIGKVPETVIETKKPEKKRFKSNVSPDKAFNDFYNTNTEIIEEEKVHLQNEENMDEEAINQKIKKTYKNRYQTIKIKLQT